MSGDKSAQRHRPHVALVGELLHELARESQCDLAHLLGREVADRMRQLDERMSVHAFGAKRVDRCILERLRQKHSRRDSAFFELYRVVHTAQRA